MRKPFSPTIAPAVMAALIAVSGALAAPALAQQTVPDPGAKPSALEQDYQTRDQATMNGGGQTALAAPGEDLTGLTVYDSTGEAVGEVERVEALPNGDIDSLIVTQGGILGVGAKKVSVDGHNVTVEGDRVVLDLTGSQVSELPDHEDATEGPAAQVPATEGDTQRESAAGPDRSAN